MKKILVTGGAGFVGRHLIKQLLDQGHKIDCVDNVAKYTGGINPNKGWPTYNPFDYKNFSFYQEDCREWFKNNSDYYDVVYHLAAMVGGRLMIENHPLVVADDLSIDAEFWKWAKDNKPDISVCFSSSAAYPIKLQTQDYNVLLKEDMIDFNSDIGMPDMTYGWAKLTSEYLAKLAHEKYGLNTISFRPFSGYGSDQDMAYPFPSICKRILDNVGADTINVWGSGLQKRDFIHIDDCVTGILLMQDKIINGDAVNLSTGKLTSFIELATKTANIAGFNPKIIGTSDKPEGVFARGGDISKQQEFGFNATIDLDMGIKQALEYLK